MRSVLLIIFFLLSASSTRANSLEVDIVGWSNSNSQFDTTVNVNTSDTLVFINRATSIAAFFKYVNGVRVDTIMGVQVNDTIDVHALIFSDTVITYYIWTQVLSYGLRCHIHYPDVSIETESENVPLLAIAGSFLTVRSPTSSSVLVFDFGGRIVSEHAILAGTTEQISLLGLKPGAYLAVLKNESGIITVRKIGLIN